MEMLYRRDSLESRAIAETRFNARMLYQDAKLLFEAKRWGTSISLSILACEEAGKFVMLNHMLGTDFDSIGTLRHHKDKQAEFSRYLRSCIRVKELDALLQDRGEADAQERAIFALRFFGACMESARADETSMEALTSDPTFGPIYSELQERTRKDPAYEIAQQAACGDLDQIKQRGLYVDTRDRAVLAPRDFTQEQATLYLRACQIVVDSVAPESMFGSEPVPFAYAKMTIEASR